MKKSIISTLILTTVLVIFIFLFQVYSYEYTKGFTDVSQNEWYAESVEYVCNNGLMNGISETTFEPGTHITRGMIVTIIYRMENSPETTGILKFKDVNENYYYTKPIMWATNNKIVTGYNENTFAPEDKITREQFATILYRYAKYKGLNISADETDSKQLKSYTDNDKISDYSKETMAWASSSKLITGVTTTTLVPQGIATRAQAATIFMRFDKLLKQAVQGNNTNQMLPENEQNKNNNPPIETDKKDDNINQDENAGEWDDINPETNDKISKEDLNSPTIYVDDAYINGKYAEVVISVINNPGIASIKFSVEFDDKSLRLASVSFDSQWGDYITAPTPYKNPQTINLISPFENITKNGRLATLKFEILDESYDKNITVKCDKNNIFNSDFNEVKFDVINGKIKSN